MDLVKIKVIKGRRNRKMTVLYRKDGTWSDSEVCKLTENLTSIACMHPAHPEYLILTGHHTKEETLKAIGGCISFTAAQLVDMDCDELPFTPQF